MTISVSQKIRKDWTCKYDEIANHSLRSKKSVRVVSITDQGLPYPENTIPFPKMPLRRQSDHSHSQSKARKVGWANILPTIARHRQTSPVTLSTSSHVLFEIAAQYVSETEEIERYEIRKRHVSTTSFSFKFGSVTDATCLALFRFQKSDISRMVLALGWPTTSRVTSRNRHSCNPLLVTCVVFRRLASPARWFDLELLFDKYYSQISEWFWEGIEAFLNARSHLIMGNISPEYMNERAEMYSRAVHEKTGALDNCVGFIDGTVLGISRPGKSAKQLVMYNGHKRKYALKYQVVTTPDGLILHAAGPIEGRRHDWTLYVRNGLEEQLSELLFIAEKQYVIYGDSGYNVRSFMEVPFQGSNLFAAQRAFN